jgi:hypothetical protein
MQVRPKVHILALLNVIISSMAGLSLLASAAMLLIVGILALTGSASEQAYPLFSLGWNAVLVVMLLLPGIFYSLEWLTGKRLLPRYTSGLPIKMATILAICLWPLAIFAGDRIARTTDVTRMVLPALQVLAVGIPLWLLVRLGIRGIHKQTRQRIWGTLNFGLIVTSPVALAVEIIVFAAAGLLGVFWVMTRPDLIQELERLASRLMVTQANPDMVLRIIKPYMQKPLVIFSVLAAGAGLAPLVEELIKPLALWLFVRKLQPADGFVLGVISGAAFALLESLNNLANPLGTEWAAVVFGRLGTGILHTVTTGLTGWALASAWSKRQYIRVGAATLLAMCLHMLWNTFGLLVGFNGVLKPENPIAILSLRLGSIAPLAMIVLAVAMVAILIIGNHLLKKESPQTIGN